MTTEFRITGTDTIIGRTENTRNGFRHVVEYLRNGQTLETRSVSYLNRTWESYDYESAISALLDKMIKNRMILPEDKPRIMAITAGKAKADLDARFGSIAMVAQMGEVLAGDSLKEKNAWKLRMIKAGLGNGISLPDDWESLPETEKAKRLDAIIAHMKR